MASGDGVVNIRFGGDRSETRVVIELGRSVKGKVLGDGAGGQAVVLALPIPLGNGPEAFAICIVALGLFEGDERVVGIGVIGGVLAILVNAGIVVAGFELFHAAKHIHHAVG